MSKQLVVYIAGPYRAEHEFGVFGNILAAREIALDVWRYGVAQGIPLVALCPHMNTALFGGACPDAVWLEGDLELLRRCDAVMLVPGWEKSSGTRAEMEEAKRVGLPVFETLSGLGKWAGEMQALMAKGPSEFDNMMQILREAVTIAGRLHGVMKDVDESAAIELDGAGGMLMEAINTIDRRREKGWKAPELVTGGEAKAPSELTQVRVDASRGGNDVGVDKSQLRRRCADAAKSLGLVVPASGPLIGWNVQMREAVWLLNGVLRVDEEGSCGVDGGGAFASVCISASTNRGVLRGIARGVKADELPNLWRVAMCDLVDCLLAADFVADKASPAQRSAGGGEK